MHISEEGIVSGSVNRSQLIVAYDAATDDAVKANLAQTAYENGMVLEDGKLVDPSDVQPEPDEAVAEPAEQAEQDTVTTEAPESSGRPAQNDSKSAWVDWAVTQGADRDEAEALTKAELVEFYGKE